MIKFRWHRGSLEDSLATVKEFESMKKLFNYIVNVNFIVNAPRLNGKKFVIDRLYKKINISFYGYDERCNQDLYIVTVDKKAVGFIFEEISDAKG